MYSLILLQCSCFTHYQDFAMLLLSMEISTSNIAHTEHSPINVITALRLSMHNTMLMYFQLTLLITPVTHIWLEV